MLVGTGKPVGELPPAVPCHISLSTIVPPILGYENCGLSRGNDSLPSLTARRPTRKVAINIPMVSAMLMVIQK